MDRDLDDSASQEFRHLSNRIEVELTAPSVVLVTAATPRDGSSSIAYRLAKAFSAAQRRTTFLTSQSLSTNEIAHGLTRYRTAFNESSDIPSSIAKARDDDGLQIIELSQNQVPTISRVDLDARLGDLRLSNDYIIIDGGAFFEDTIGVLTAPCADGILLTFLAGRSRVPADAAVINTIEHCSGRLLGLIMTDKMALSRFKHSRVTSVEGESQRAPFALRLMRRFGVALRRLVKDVQ